MIKIENEFITATMMDGSRKAKSGCAAVGV